MTERAVATIRKNSGWSAIWVLPLLALVIGAWLAWRSYSEAGIGIQIRFDSGEGIQADKTEVVYKGMTVGKVVEITPSEDLQYVMATVVINRQAQDYLSEDTRFWLVKPRVSIAGVTGLETLVSGNYIAIDPVKGKLHHEFVALTNPPPMSDRLPGLHLTLKADKLGSLEAGSPVYYRQIKVGQVKSYGLADDLRTIEVKVHIEEDYAHLVRKHSRFWNTSGVSISGGLSGFKVRSESLVSMVAGGIAFFTPDSRQDSPPTNGSPFRLYEDFDAAEAGFKVSLKLKDVSGLQAGHTPVMYSGVQVGTLQTLAVGESFREATATLAMDPKVEELLVEGSEFWMVRPSISLAGITGLEALVKGNYIEVRFAGNGKPSRSFVMRDKAPPLNTDAPGLHLVVTTPQLGSLSVGSPVLYRQMRVGSVQSYQLARDKRQVLLGLHIEPEYAALVNHSTRFWNASGIRISGGLSGVEVHSESLQTLVAGGIAFDTDDLQAAPLQGVGRFELYADQQQAEASSGGLLLSLRLDSAEGLSEGAPLRYRGLQVGRIERLELAEDLGGVVARVRVDEAAQRIARSGSRFWVAKVEVGMSGVSNLGNLVSGNYLEVMPGRVGEQRQLAFRVDAQAPKAMQGGLPLVLSTERRHSLKAGAPVTYREVKVGEVTAVELGATADRVLVHLLIEPRYAALVHTGSRFWSSSGIGIEAGLFKGVQVRTESLETLLAGGVAFATPDEPRMGSKALPGQTFALFDAPDESWLQWAPRIALDK